MSNIKQTFEKLRAKKEGALVAYVMAGDPSPEATLKIADALIKGGIDVLELGLPFSDPIADGPTIQQATVRALNAGTTPAKVLEIAKQIKQKHKTPVAIMTYYNPIFKMGLDGFFAKAKACYVDGQSSQTCRLKSKRVPRCRSQKRQRHHLPRCAFHQRKTPGKHGRCKLGVPLLGFPFRRHGGSVNA
jgi:hypothetical protein